MIERGGRQRGGTVNGKAKGAANGPTRSLSAVLDRGGLLGARCDSVVVWRGLWLLDLQEEGLVEVVVWVFWRGPSSCGPA